MGFMEKIGLAKAVKVDQVLKKSCFALAIKNKIKR